METETKRDLSTVRTVLFDMDGVVYRGKTRLPGVIETMAFCREHHIPFACITNNSSKTPQQFEQKLHAMGVDMSSEQVLSSAVIAGRFLRSHYPRGSGVYIIGMDGLRQAVLGDGYFVEAGQNADVVVLGVDLYVTYEKFKIACLAIRSGAGYVVTNPDKAFPSEEGLLPGSGALAAFVQTATDVAPLIVGKPEQTMFQTALEMLRATPETTVVIGDRLETDIAGARNAGLQSVLVLTGVTSREQLERSPYQPDAVFHDLTEFLDTWKAHYQG